jgi:hypothetical protein
VESLPGDEPFAEKLAKVRQGYALLAERHSLPPLFQKLLQSFSLLPEEVKAHVSPPTGRLAELVKEYRQLSPEQRVELANRVSMRRVPPTETETSTLTGNRDKPPTLLELVAANELPTQPKLVAAYFAITGKAASGEGLARFRDQFDGERQKRNLSVLKGQRGFGNKALCDVVAKERRNRKWSRRTGGGRVKG